MPHPPDEPANPTSAGIVHACRPSRLWLRFLTNIVQAEPQLVCYGQALLNCLGALLRPPLPRRQAVMRMHAAVGGAGLFLPINIVDAVASKRPSEPLADHDGAQILARDGGRGRLCGRFPLDPNASTEGADWQNLSRAFFVAVLVARFVPNSRQELGAGRAWCRTAISKF